jgi:uncharacterized protein (UPF0333 family)
MFRHRLRGQSTLEYVILLGFVVAALIAMGIYMKRGFQGKLRESTDQVGEQYSAGKTTSTYTSTSNMSQSESTAPGGISSTTSTSSQDRTGSEIVPALSSD